jgi:prepilin-type N-terminal cleavage/methylation domain-containing protein
MRTTLSTNREQGLTLVELFVVMAIIAVFAIMVTDLSATPRAKTRALRIQCVNNLKQTGLAFRVWEGDQQVIFPMQRSTTNGGTMEFTTGPNLWRHFQVMSNELSTPKVLICPADESRNAATNFAFLRNSNISFFVGVDASETNPQLILSGDRNITNGTPIKNGILEVSSNQPAGWAAEMHNKVGNVALSDGSLQQISSTGLRSAIENSGGFTNRLQMPVLGP